MTTEGTRHSRTRIRKIWIQTEQRSPTQTIKKIDGVQGRKKVT